MVSILASITVAELSSGEARAINVAGSLRMQSYAIGAALNLRDPAGTEAAIAEFERRYASADIRLAIPTDGAEPIRQAYDAVGLRWHQRFRPLALRAGVEPGADVITAGGIAQERQALVAAIDKLVELIEEHHESKLDTLRLVQGISLILLVLVGAAAVLQLKRKVLLPLQDLLRSADRVRHSDFSVRVPIREADELGQLGEAFNFMVEDLSRSYAELEDRVREKTEALGRSNQSLNLLYRTTRALSERTVTRSTLQQVLKDVEHVIGVGRSAICLGKAADMETIPSNEHPVTTDTLCRAGCHGCDNADKGITLQALDDNTAGHVLSAPLFDGGRNHGSLLLTLPAGTQLAPWQVELLETVGRHVGAALTSSQRNEERHRLALLDERSVIARELHDSLAQSLSYLKIQVTRLQTLLRPMPPPEPVSEIVGELRDGLNEAYRQLRELLTTFRLRIDGRGLNAAIEDAVQEFSRRTGLTIHLENNLTDIELPASREIHVLQIVREALTNIERHAHASRATVTLRRENRERLRVTVEDDGIGFDETARPLHRFGLVIMHDRAQSLAGAVTVRAGEHGGTRVELDFPAEAPISDSPLPPQGQVS